MARPTDDVLSLDLTYDRNEGVVFAPANGRPGRREVAFLTGNIEEGDTLGQMFAASPAMTRVLLALMPEGKTMAHDMERHTAACWQTGSSEPCLPECKAARAALARAGVL